MRCLCLGVALESSTKFRCRLPPSVAEGLLLLAAAHLPKQQPPVASLPPLLTARSTSIANCM